MQTETRAVEWPTLIVFAATYALWALATTWLWPLSPVLAIAAAALAIAQFSSLTHEVLHGHPFRSQLWSEALVFPGLTVLVPYLRFKDLHLQHHFDPALTDPYDDPESNYLDPAVWARLSRPVQLVLQLNNTLAGRILIGPAVSTVVFLASDWRLARKGDRRVMLAWALHLAGLALVLAWLLTLGQMPVWAYLVAVYLSMSLLKIRTFLEHRAHEAARARTVVIESRGPLSLLFLNNNFHVVHHMHPAVPWYRLPAMYFANRDHYLRRNDGYRYRSYAEIFRQFLFRAKDPVPHPIWPVEKGGALDQPTELRGGAGIVEERHAGLITARQ
ncbi:fatty acid desaturase [Rhodobacter calidifons]|uniref:Fatty acid desaturase n=1 Tax=Rhodobacter calidifons TaxID=2715277 RepID=A0ABX0GBL4_9RHOB|nr:fatty acid desaturase [Rhodobacter calidifons]NHB78516.1 fatty acid desaturase [Rhodobacter calidifons]